MLFERVNRQKYLMCLFFSCFVLFWFCFGFLLLLLFLSLYNIYFFCFQLFWTINYFGFSFAMFIELKCVEKIPYCIKIRRCGMIDNEYPPYTK